jgi:hypothetical protein
MPGAQQQKFKQASHRRLLAARRAAAPHVKDGGHSRAERLLKVSHLTVPSTPPTMNPAFDPQRPRAQGGPTPARPASAEQPPGSPAQQPAGRPEARREPSFEGQNFGDSTATPFAGSTYARLEQEPSWYQQTGPLHKNPVSRAAFMAVIFVVGAAVGLAATWWMNKPVDKPPTAPTVRKFEPPLSTPAPGGSSRSATSNASGTSGASGASGSTAVPAAPVTGSTDGINPGELPYDGNPPGASVNAAPTAAAPTVDRLPKTEPKEPPRQAEGPRKTEAARNAGVSRNTENQRNAGKTEAEAEMPAAPVVTAPPPSPTLQKKAEQALAGAQEDPPAKAPPAKPRETKVAKAPPRQHRAAPAIPKDKEIDRIRQQADEELKKKIRAGDVTEAARSRTERADPKASTKSDDDAPSRVAGQGSRRAALARCEREEDSLIGREMCKWKVCGGMWGKQGCPSYDRQVSAHY